MECVTAVDSAIEVRGEAELRLRTAPIYQAARSRCPAPRPTCGPGACCTCRAPPRRPSRPGCRGCRTASGSASSTARQCCSTRARPRTRDQLEALGARIRITTAALHETILIDRRVVDHGRRPGRAAAPLPGAVSAPEVVQSVAALFDAAWRTADRPGRVRGLAERAALPRARACSTRSPPGPRTRRRPGPWGCRCGRTGGGWRELMAAVGATSRFQAGLRARELGLV